MRQATGRSYIVALGRIALVLSAIILLSIGGALTAANVVEQTAADEKKEPINRSQLAPAACSGLTLNTTISGTVAVVGTIDNDWLIGSEAVDTMDGLAGDDCIEGKGEADVIDGGLGNDVCIGGAGVDTFVGCETEIQ